MQMWEVFVASRSRIDVGFAVTDGEKNCQSGGGHESQEIVKRQYEIRNDSTSSSVHVRGSIQRVPFAIMPKKAIKVGCRDDHFVTVRAFCLRRHT
jgi:hypothetical protein